MQRNAERGFSLLELAVVVAIVLILALIALPNMNQMLPRFRLNRTVKEFNDHIQMARLLSISQNREYRICMVAMDTNPTTTNIKASVGEYTISAGNASLNSTSWDVIPLGTDDTEGRVTLTYSASNRQYAGVSLTGWSPMTGPSTGNANCIVFSPRGWLTNPSSDYVNGYVQVYFRNLAANPRNESRTVLISRGGSTRIRAGGAGTVNTGA